MNRSSSSISSSRLQALLATCGWTLLALLLIDVAIGLAFPMPADPRVQPGGLAQYFDYGRSIEGKLARMVGPDDATSSPIVAAGWLDRECARPRPLPAGKLGVSLYGMSFTERVGAALRKADPDLAITTYSGPAAGFNHSFACYEMLNSAGRDPNRIQIIGILASSVGRMATLGGLTTSFEAPQPFTYPRYILANGALARIEPIVHGPADLRDTAKMAAYRTQLARWDAYYDPLLMDATPLDHSAMFRLLQRAHAHRHGRAIDRGLIGQDGNFLANAELGAVMRAMLREFARSSRARGQMPIVILIEDRDMGRSLHAVLGDELRQDDIGVVRTDLIAPPSDRANFVADGHFVAAVDRRIGEALDAEIRRLARP